MKKILFIVVAAFSTWANFKLAFLAFYSTVYLMGDRVIGFGPNGPLGESHAYGIICLWFIFFLAHLSLPFVARDIARR